LLWGCPFCSERGLYLWFLLDARWIFTSIFVFGGAGLLVMVDGGPGTLSQDCRRIVDMVILLGFMLSSIRSA
jgi:hypothetical protein